MAAWLISKVYGDVERGEGLFTNSNVITKKFEFIKKSACFSLKYIFYPFRFRPTPRILGQFKTVQVEFGTVQDGTSRIRCSTAPFA